MSHERHQDQEQSNEPLTMAAVSQEAREVLLREGQHLPTVIIDGLRKRVVMRLVGVPPNHTQRLAQMFAAGYQLAEQVDLGGLRQVFHISEAWLSRAQPGEALALPPSQDPQRHEVLVISQLDIVNRQVQLAAFEMLRDADGQLSELRVSDMGDTEGKPEDAPLLVAFVAGYGEALSQDTPHQ
ncbi:MAG: hypothetical protein KC547_06310 [Anaerolineae bacterium]|nr:hypothetical protein [Anaerolineae bacterium]